MSVLAAPGAGTRAASHRRVVVVALVYLIPAALLGLLGLGLFLWAVRSGQFDDLDGAAHRILDDD